MYALWKKAWKNPRYINCPAHNHVELSTLHDPPMLGHVLSYFPPITGVPSQPETGRREQWADFTEFFTPAISQLRQEPGRLSAVWAGGPRAAVEGTCVCSCYAVGSTLTDRVACVFQAGTFEVLLVHFAPLFDSKISTMLFDDGKITTSRDRR